MLGFSLGVSGFELCVFFIVQGCCEWMGFVLVLVILLILITLQFACFFVVCLLFGDGFAVFWVPYIVCDFVLIAVGCLLWFVVVYGCCTFVYCGAVFCVDLRVDGWLLTLCDFADYSLLRFVLAGSCLIGLVLLPLLFTLVC